MPITITGGEMRFSRYVELGRPFRIELVKRDTGSATLAVQQAGRDCTSMTLDFEQR